MSEWCGENVFEFLNNQGKATVTLCQGRYISKIKELAEKYPDECDYIMNKDGTLCGHIPTKWIKISANKRELTDEQRNELSERARNNFKLDKL